jgi:hypothetical protein
MKEYKITFTKENIHQLYATSTTGNLEHLIKAVKGDSIIGNEEIGEIGIYHMDEIVDPYSTPKNIKITEITKNDIDLEGII